MAGKPDKPDPAIYAEIKTAEGTTYRWGTGESDAGKVPQGIKFSTRLGDGFSDGGCTLARRIDRDYYDINLLDEFTLFGADGSIAYEGRIGANPRSISDVHSMDIVTAGWMTHTRDKKAQIIFVDRNVGNWIPASVRRRKALITGNYTGEPEFQLGVDDAGSPGIITPISDAWSATGVGDSEAWYDSRGLGIGRVYYAWNKSSSVNAGDTNWNWLVCLSSDDNQTVLQTTSNLRAAGPGTGLLSSTGATKYYADVQFYYNIVAAGAAGTTFAIYWTCLAVYGKHGLALQGTPSATSAYGLTVSDMLDYLIRTFCPKLDPSGISSTTYPVQQAAWLDPTDPYDIIADLNKYHRYIFGCEENKRFFFRPVDLTDYDWAIDYNDPGVTVDLQGDSTDGGLYNGIAVNFTDLTTGKASRLTPTTTPSLATTDSENVVTRHGYDRWYEFTLSTPALPADAAAIGAAALAEVNTPKGQGTITVKGHVKDKAGHWQQGWKVRAGDRIAIVSSTSLSDRPRLISETSWDQDSLTLSISVEDTAQKVDAFLDRLSSALSAAGLQQ